MRSHCVHFISSGANSFRSPRRQLVSPSARVSPRNQCVFMVQYVIVAALVGEFVSILILNPPWLGGEGVCGTTYLT